MSRGLTESVHEAAAGSASMEQWGESSTLNADCAEIVLHAAPLLQHCTNATLVSPLIANCHSTVPHTNCRQACSGRSSVASTAHCCAPPPPLLRPRSSIAAPSPTITRPLKHATSCGAIAGVGLSSLPSRLSLRLPVSALHNPSLVVVSSRTDFIHARHSTPVSVCAFVPRWPRSVGISAVPDDPTLSY